MSYHQIHQFPTLVAMLTRAWFENIHGQYLAMISTQHQRLRTEIERALVEDLPQLDHGLNWLEEKIKLPKMHLLSGFVTLLVWIAFCDWVNLVTKFVGFIYPLYQSIQALDTQERDNVENWLAYWTVLGCLHIIEWIYSDILFWWVPIYVPYFWILKSTILAICMPTTLNGANYVYRKVLQPTFMALKTLDQKINGKMTSETADKIKKSEQKIKGKMTPQTAYKFSAKRQ